MPEFLLGLLLSVASVTATFSLLQAEWNRVHCAYVTFEATHARMIGLRVRSSSLVTVTEGPVQVQGRGACGQARESVELPWLESPI